MVKHARPGVRLDALVPVKAILSAKSRLADRLGVASRSLLVKAMLGDVVSALRASRVVEDVYIVGRGHAVHRLGRTLGCRVMKERRAPSQPAAGRDAALNAALAMALKRMKGRRSVLIAHADLPWLNAETVECIAELHRGSSRAIALAAEPRRGGTSLLALRRTSAISLCFGPSSASRHDAEALRLGLRARRVASGPTIRDVDDAEDLDMLLDPRASPPAGRRTRRWAARRLQNDPVQALRLLDADPSRRLDDRLARSLGRSTDVRRLAAMARRRRELSTGALVTWSPKVFLPLTQLCRDVCHYCTFAQTPARAGRAFMSVDDVLQIVSKGIELGCAEALFTLGDRPEARWPEAADALRELGASSTIDHLVTVAGRVLGETGMLPHINAGVLSDADIARLRRVSASMGLMLECVSDRLCEPGMPHHGSPDKQPARRMATIDAAGRARVPFTSGILIGIGETREERVDSLLALRASHLRHGHLQEVIVQGFQPKAGTKMANAAAASLDELCWTIAVARLLLPPEVALQAPPNLSPGQLGALLDAGINDFGGVSPLTRDHVNPEAPWPAIDVLRSACVEAGLVLQPRLTLHPRFARDPSNWAEPAVATSIRRLSDADGLFRQETWRTGKLEAPPSAWLDALQEGRPLPTPTRTRPRLSALLRDIANGRKALESEATFLLEARGDDVLAVCDAAEQMARRMHGERVSYVVTRNINYTNRCTHGCTFCAFSKPALKQDRGAPPSGDAPYNLSLDAIATRAEEAWARGATEVCLQGGIHPRFDGNTYLDIVRAVREAVPAIHIHAFSPLEVWHGASTLQLPLQTYLERLRDAGLRSLPGTAAEILDDEVRAVLCPDKIDTAQWLAVMRTAHAVGLRSTATMMFGHVDAPRHWARHLTRVRCLQDESAGFTEFVPLPFVAVDTPIYRRGLARPGPTFREVLLVHAVSRLVFAEGLPNVQASWVKLGAAGAGACLRAGANDLGGTLMNESITRAAGALHGQEMTPEQLQRIAADAGRSAWQRTTLYAAAPVDGPVRRAGGTDAVAASGTKPPTPNGPIARFLSRASIE